MAARASGHALPGGKRGAVPGDAAEINGEQKARSRHSLSYAWWRQAIVNMNHLAEPRSHTHYAACDHEYPVIQNLQLCSEPIGCAAAF
jgi:hypothetical protein